jgi:hypothetical protein
VTVSVLFAVQLSAAFIIFAYSSAKLSFNRGLCLFILGRRICT